ncbi:MobF family relaxase [Actinopolyspora halophila]|uniref:MobF family relaxase n=1 Tax=Actinopolyspora halophila TaxID=1850 RepID=UPI0003A8E4BD|nr:MobF family relaxase [Actinopolyspora halophila]
MGYVVIAVRKLSPSGHEYLTGSVACGDRDLEPGEALFDYYTAHGYPAGEWFGSGAVALGVSGEVTAAQMNALFGEGRHPDADRIEAERIAEGASKDDALAETKLGYRFRQHSGADELRRKVAEAYKAYNREHGRPVDAAIDQETRTRIRQGVQKQAYAEAHDGQHPDDAELHRWLAEQKREQKDATAGYELVFAPPKSVSVVWALSDDNTRELIAELHRQAVRDTLSWFENNAAFTRKGDGGYAQYDSRGITAALFEHWDSRAGDPHLHTHVPISAKVQGPDGKWTSLDGRTVLAASVTTSEHYNSRLRDLFREHGASWSERPQGGIDLKRPVWELDGVPDDLLAGFSHRASAVEAERAARIVEFRREHGREPGPKDMLEISRRAQYGTREAKQVPRSLSEHVQRWRVQAEEMVEESTLGAALSRRVFPGGGEHVAEVDVSELAARTLATVSDHYSHFNTWNIEAEVHRQTAHLRVEDGSREQLVDRVVEAVLADPDTVSLQPPPAVEEPSELRRASGESVFVEHNAQRYTTHRTLREESALAAWGRRRDGVRISDETVQRALGRARLNAGQQRAVSGFATSGRRVQLLHAPAGAGKTTAMRVFADAWRAEAGEVYAFGPSARAAQELGRSLQARPHTLHQVTTAMRLATADKVFPFARGDVLVIDEAAMAGTHTLHDVVRHALNRGADVRLVGDDKQLAAVEAGGAVRWFAHTNGALHLREVVRFADQQQAAASLKLHSGDPSGLDYYFEQGWVREGSRETMREAAHRAWRGDLDVGRPSLLIVPANEDVVALNRQARELRLQRGDVDGDRAVRLHDGTAAGKGDLVVTRRNDRLKTLFGGKDFVKNGDTWQVQTVRRSGALKVRHQASGGSIVLPTDYVAENVELAYATTVNRSQGMSVTGGSSHSLVPQGLSREQLYAQSTRAEHDNRLYVETVQHTIDSHRETPPERTARGVLEAALQRSSAETSATEQLRACLGRAESLRTLVGHHDYVAHLGAEERIESVLTEHVPRLLDLPAAPALRQTVRTAEDFGWQVEHLVPSALARSSLDGADDPAAMLQWHLEQRLLNEQPPPRSADPTMAQINRWRGIVEVHAANADVEEPSWMPVWRRAAAATADGLDAEAALDTTAVQLSRRPSNDPVPACDYAADVLAAALDEQRADGAGWQPALPWMARPDFTGLSREVTDYARQLNTAVEHRHHELREHVIADPPRWTTALGPRPQDPAAAEDWDHLVGLAAAYRETYGITTDDPAHPLGEQPGSQGLRAHAWHELINQWNPAELRSAVELGGDSTTELDPVERIRAEFDADELSIAVAGTDTADTALRTEDSLAVLTERHQRLTDTLFDTATQHALVEHAPATLDQPAEPALRTVLRRAQRDGWDAERLVDTTAAQGDLDAVADPAAVLARRIESHIADRHPPARVTEPDEEQIRRWQILTTYAAPDLTVTDPAWQLVWRHAAAGAADGLDADAAVSTAAEQLTYRADDDPTEAHRYAAQLVVDQLDEQREQNTADVPVLSWLTTPHYTVRAADPELADQLEQVTEAAHARLAELCEQVSAEPPDWTSGLGPRPEEPVTAEHWDELAGLVAAYRETYNIRSTDPDTPLGPDPSGQSAKAEAWRVITDAWRQPMTTPNDSDHHDDTLARLEALREAVLDHSEGSHDEQLKWRADDRDDESSDEHYRYDDDERLDQDNDLQSGLGL